MSAGHGALAFTGPDGNTLIGERVGAGPLVVLLHGGGQTRQSWARTARRLAHTGYSVLSLDLRGHGDSDWSEIGAYGTQHYAGDLLAVLDRLDEQPALVGASLGGITAMTTLGQQPDGGSVLARCMVLVDVTPTMQTAGLERIRSFMLAAPDGFADVDEAAEAVSSYLPGRARPASAAGLAKNLRVSADGRYHWHWDPRILDALPNQDAGHHEMLRAMAARVRVPTLLVRGGRSDVVSDDGVRELRELIPHALVSDVGGAGHVVVGDDNDAFAESMMDFLAVH